MIVPQHPLSAAQAPAGGPASPLRVLHVIGGLELGGAETLLYRLVTSADGIDHRIICLGARGWYSDALERHGVPVEYLGMHSARSFAARLARLIRLIRQAAPDVIQSWLYMSNLIAGMAGRKLGIPVVWGIHGSTYKHLGPSSRLAARIAGRSSRWLAAHVINCSRRAAAFHQVRGYARVPGSVIHNGYDASAFAPDDAARERTRADLGIEPGQFVVGTVSRWHFEKDLPTLLGALAILSQKGLRPTTILIGPGLDDANQPLHQAIAQFGLVGTVRTLGRRGDVPDLARAIDLHVLPSLAEAFPNVIAETMLSGAPNAVTDVGDSGAMVGNTGWVVAPRRAELLADAIEDALCEWRDHPARWQARRGSARERIATKFTAAAMRENYERVWRSVARRPR